jgi:hypothetical protein
MRRAFAAVPRSLAARTSGTTIPTSSSPFLCRRRDFTSSESEGGEKAEKETASLLLARVERDVLSRHGHTLASAERFIREEIESGRVYNYREFPDPAAEIQRAREREAGLGIDVAGQPNEDLTAEDPRREGDDDSDGDGRSGKGPSMEELARRPKWESEIVAVYNESAVEAGDVEVEVGPPVRYSDSADGLERVSGPLAAVHGADVLEMCYGLGREDVERAKKRASMAAPEEDGDEDSGDEQSDEGEVADLDEAVSSAARVAAASWAMKEARLARTHVPGHFGMENAVSRNMGVQDALAPGFRAIALNRAPFFGELPDPAKEEGPTAGVAMTAAWEDVDRVMDALSPGPPEKIVGDLLPGKYSDVFAPDWMDGNWGVQPPKNPLFMLLTSFDPNPQDSVFTQIGPGLVERWSTGAAVVSSFLQNGGRDFRTSDIEFILEMGPMFGQQALKDTASMKLQRALFARLSVEGTRTGTLEERRQHARMAARDMVEHDLVSKKLARKFERGLVDIIERDENFLLSPDMVQQPRTGIVQDLSLSFFFPRGTRWDMSDGFTLMRHVPLEMLGLTTVPLMRELNTWGEWGVGLILTYLGNALHLPQERYYHQAGFRREVGLERSVALLNRFVAGEPIRLLLERLRDVRVHVDMDVLHHSSFLVSRATTGQLAYARPTAQFGTNVWRMASNLDFKHTEPARGRLVDIIPADDE